MKEFLPLEDDWSLIEAFLGQRLVPYQPGMSCAHQAKVSGAQVDGAASAGKNFRAPPSQPSGAAL